MTLELLALNFVSVFPYLFIILLTVFAFKRIHDWWTKYDDDAAIRSGNSAAGFARGAMYLGLIIAMCGPLLTEQLNVWVDLLVFAIEGVAAVAVMTLASVVFDKVVLPKIDNREQIGAGNRAVAVVEAASYIGLGFIMLSSLAGGSAPTFLRDIGSSLLFIGLGLGSLVGIYLIFGLIYKQFYKVTLSQEIAAGNVAIAIEAAGVILGMSLVLGFSIIGDFNGWIVDIMSFLVAAIAGVLAVVIIQVLSRLWFTRGSTLREDGSHAANTASASINAFLAVAFGLATGLAIFV